jgi:hypothetical protein
MSEVDGLGAQQKVRVGAFRRAGPVHWETTTSRAQQRRGKPIV